MDFGGDSLRENHHNVRSYGTQDYTVRKAYEDGEFLLEFIMYLIISVLIKAISIIHGIRRLYDVAR